MDKTQADDILQVSDVENAHLIAQYSEEEVKKAVLQIEHNKAPVRMVF